MYPPVRRISRILWTFCAVMFVGYVFLQAIQPLGTTENYSLGDESGGISHFEPHDRVQSILSNNSYEYYQIDDLIYFDISMPHRFEAAEVTVTFQNPWDDQDIYLGFRDKVNWHYNTKLIDSPMLRSLAWEQTGDSPTLYQRIKRFNSVEEFLNNPPEDAVIGLYNYDIQSLQLPTHTLENYSPKTDTTLLTSPLRGKHTFYVYLENEPFTMEIMKQDLNWYEGPDFLTVDVYKENELVYEAVAHDDGIVDASGKAAKPQTIGIKNPGPGLPERGVYKIILDTTSDTVITQISTNLHKIVFSGPIFTVGNATVYPTVAHETIPVDLVTDSIRVTLKTPHNETTQSATFGTENLELTSSQILISTSSGFGLKHLISPKSDVIINGVPGYFAFHDSSFFKPLRLNTIAISQRDDLNFVDYIVSDVPQSITRGNDQIATVKFDLSSAYISNNKLSWVIRAPALRDQNRHIVIKNINIALIKRPLFQ